MNSKTFNSKAFTRLFFCLAASFLPISGANAEASNDSLPTQESTEMASNSRKMASNSIRLTGDVSFVTSRLFTDFGELSKPWGYGIGVEYTHLWKVKGKNEEKPNYLGLTLVAQYKDACQGYEIMTSFLGAGVTWAIKTDKGFAWYTTFGLGYAYSSDIDLYLDNSGVGVFAMLGFDYMVTKHFGIGASLNPLACFYKEPKYYDNPSYYGKFDKIDNYGVAHYDIRLGFSWHF